MAFHDLVDIPLVSRVEQSENVIKTKNVFRLSKTLVESTWNTGKQPFYVSEDAAISVTNSFFMEWSYWPHDT